VAAHPGAAGDAAVLSPLWLWLHRRFGVLLPVWLAGAAALVDVARFSYDVPWIGWANMWFVWGLAFVALATFQIGALSLLRPARLARIDRPRWVKLRTLMNIYAMPLYLLHSTGTAIALYGFWRLTGERADNLEISGLWWVTRPLAVLVPLLITLPLLWGYGRLRARSSPMPVPLRSSHR
jgi:hypothetical protein